MKLVSVPRKLHDTAVTDAAAAEQRVDPLAQTRVEATLGTLGRRIWIAVKANRGLVAGIMVLAFFEAVFTKAPFLLVKFLLDGLWEGTPSATPEPQTGWTAELLTWLEAGFSRFATGLNNLLGLGLAGEMLTVVSCAVALAILGVLGAATIYGMTVFSRYFGAKIVVDLRNEVLAHILRLPMRFFAKRRMGDLISSITTDTSVLTRSFTLACNNAVVDPLLILFNFFVLVLLVPDYAWVLIVVAPVMALPMLRTGRRIHKSSSRSLAAMGDSTEAMNQMLTGIRTVKSFQLEEERLREYQENNARYLRRTKKMLKAKGFSQGFLFTSYQIGFAAMLVVIGFLISSGAYPATVLAAAMLPMATTYQHVKRLVRSFNILSESVGALEGVESIMRVGVDRATIDGGLVLDGLKGDVEMKDVSFAYESERVLNDVSFVVPAGTTVALVGPTGAGKSTVMDLLARFFDPTSGRVTIDGRDLRDVNLQSYRRQVATVSQEAFLFNTTIMDNIRFGWREATDEEVFAAAERAQIHDFIAGLPEGYDTVVGERGGRLSGGQMQRITIARAIVRDPRILFLDEATSALDSESEEAVQRALDNLMEGRTSIVIAHRLATIRSAEKILVMEAGRLVEQGTHEELIREGGLYKRLSQLQRLE